MRFKTLGILPIGFDPINERLREMLGPGVGEQSSFSDLVLIGQTTFSTIGAVY